MPNTSTIKIIVIVTIISLILLFGSITILSNSSSAQLESNIEASIQFLDGETYDWGSIDYNGGAVDKSFRIKNIGKQDLEIANFKTSCMCTAVEVTLDNQDMQSFGMHTTSSWKGILHPDDMATLKVIFDPAFHGPEGVGPVTRTVTFDTNDPQHSSGELRLKGTVIKN